MEEFYSALLIHNNPDIDSDADFEVIQKISESDFKRYGDAYHEINKILNVNVFTYMTKTIGDLGRAIQADMEELKGGKLDASQPDDIVRMGIRMRSAALAFCSALHYHQEHTYEEIKQLYGEDSKQHKDVQKILNKLFEKSSEYRILYRLRNTMVHHTMEAISISARAWLDEKGETIAISTPKVDIKAMTDLDKKMDDKYRELLKALPEQKPDLLTLAYEAFKAAKDANERILPKMYPDMRDACQIIVEFDDLFNKKDGVRALTSQRSTNEPPPLNFAYSAWAKNVVLYARAIAKQK
ncbi:hypothetical protein N601_13590 [Rhodococcus erythropolis DN1]|nr:hypothetical protein N601_13590 [Rhodococcus erythropolis DN1]